MANLQIRSKQGAIGRQICNIGYEAAFALESLFRAEIVEWGASLVVVVSLSGREAEEMKSEHLLLGGENSLGYAIKGKGQVISWQKPLIPKRKG